VDAARKSPYKGDIGADSMPSPEAFWTYFSAVEPTHPTVRAHLRRVSK